MARVVIPGTMEPAQFSLFMIFVAALTARLGPDTLSARAYTVQLTTFAFFYSISIAQAAQILVTRSLGEGNVTQIVRQFRSARLRGMVGAAILSVVLWASSPVLLRLFTEDIEIYGLASALFVIGLVLEPARSLSATTNLGLIGVGDGFYVLVTGLVASWVFGLPLMYVLAFPADLGLTGIWLAMAIDEVLRASVGTLRWRHWVRQAHLGAGP
jgi:Na+-driven multidrug efflux pump